MKLKDLFVGETNQGTVQFFRYFFVGGLAFVADYGTMALLVEVFSCDELIAGAAAFILGLIVNYLLSTFWVFRHSRVGNKAAEFLLFALIGVIGLGINEAIIWLFRDVLAARHLFGDLIAADKYYLVGKLVSTVVVFLWNFFARKFFLFDSSKSNGQEKAGEEE